MKVLFAIRDEDNIVDTIVRKYQQDYKKKMTYKEAKNFTAIIRELQQNNDYDRIVISEDINQKLKNSENGEGAILKKLKHIVEASGDNTSIIYICDNKAMIKKLLEMNIYNIIIGRDKIKRNIYDTIINPKDKNSAFELYGIKDDKKTERNDKVKKNEKKESTIDLVRNIKYLNRDDLDNDKYIKRFDNLCSRLDKDDIEVIIKSLNTSTKRILRRGSTKYKRFIELQKKSQLENNDEKVDIKENTSIVENDKRRRGRPRKDKNEKEEVSVKRGRGRPRKVIESTIDTSAKKNVSSKSTTEKEVKAKKTSGENQNKEKVATKKSNKKIEGQPKKNEKSDSKSEGNSTGKRDSIKKTSNTKKSDSKRKKEIIEDDDKLEDDFFEVEDGKTFNKNEDYKNQKLEKEEDFDLEEDIDLDDNLEEDGIFSIDGDDLEDDDDLELDDGDLEDEDNEVLDDDDLEDDDDIESDDEDLEDDFDIDLDDEDLEDDDDIELDDEDLEDEDDIELDDEDLEDDDDIELDDEDLEDEDDIELDDEDLEDEDDIDLEDEDLEDEDDIELDDEDLEDEDDIDLDDEDLEDEDDIDLDDEDLEDEDDIDLDDEDLEDEDDIDLDDEDLEDEDNEVFDDEDLEDEDDIDLDDDDLEDDDILNLDDDTEGDDILNLDDDTEEDDILNLDDDTEDDDILKLDDDAEDDDILNLDDDTEEDDILNLDDDTEDDDILNLDDDTEDDDILNLDDDTEDDGILKLDDDILNLDDDTEDDDILNLDDDTEDDDILNLDDDTEDDDILNLDDDTEDDGILKLDDDAEDDDILNLDDDTEDDDILNLDDDTEDDDIINLNDDTEDDDAEDDILKLDDNESIVASDEESFSGIKNKNYNPNYNISKQLNEIDEISTNVEDSSSISGDNSRKTRKLNILEDQKVVAFVGGHGNGTSFIINNLASLLSEQGIKTAVLDLTKNKNSYYIYTENEENLRSIAFSCFEKLRSGISDGIKVNKNLTVFTTLPNSDDEIEDKDSVINTLLNNHSLILLDCDVETDLEYFTIAQEIYLVQTLDILTIQPLTSFLKKLKMNKALDEEKIRILINKDIRVNDLNDRMLISAMSVYNSPDTTYQLDLFNRDRVEYLTIPFEERNYAKYLGELAKCKLKISGYSKALINSFNKLARMVYPINGRKKSKNN